MVSGWTAERRLRQSQAIRNWSPWKHASGPKTPVGKAAASRNAFKGGRRVKLRSDLALIRAMIAQMDTEAFC